MRIEAHNFLHLSESGALGTLNIEQMEEVASSKALKIRSEVDILFAIGKVS